MLAGKEGLWKYEDGGEVLELLFPKRAELAAWNELVEIALWQSALPCGEETHRLIVPSLLEGE